MAAVSRGTSHASAVSTPLRCIWCVCVVSVIVKRPVLPPSVVDGRSRNPLYYYYIQKMRCKATHSCRASCERSESAQESGE